MAEVKDLNVTDASNTARFPENQAPSTVNNGARALEGMLARFYADNNGSISTSGSSSAYVLAASRTISTIAAGDAFIFKANHASTGATTIAIDGLATKSVKKLHDQAIAANDIESGSICHIVYDGTNFQLISSLASSGLANVVADTTPQLGGQLDVNGNALGDGTLELLKFSETGSAVNEFTIANAATGAGPTLSATGTDSNVGINISAKGTGVVTVSSSMNPSLTSTGKALVLGF
jgi:hypothetical protein